MQAAQGQRPMSAGSCRSCRKKALALEQAATGSLVRLKKALASSPAMRPSPSQSASANQASTVSQGTPSTSSLLLGLPSRSPMPAN